MTTAIQLLHVIREQAVEAHRRQLAIRCHESEQLDRYVQQLTAHYHQHQQQLATLLSQHILNMRLIDGSRDVLEGLRLQLKQLRERVREADERLIAARQELLAAEQARQVLQNLSQRQHVLRREQQVQREQLELDDCRPRQPLEHSPFSVEDRHPT